MKDIRAISKLIGYLLSLSTIFVSSLSAQTNLIPNPSFEQHETLRCETQRDLRELIWDWYTVQASPDVYSPKLKSCPRWGNVPAQDGENCIGFFSLHEQIGTELHEKTIADRLYYIEFWAKTSSKGIASNNLGVWLTKKEVINAKGWHKEIIGTPQFVINDIIYNTSEWKKFEAFIRIDDAYEYLHVGNFLGEAQTQYDTLPSFPSPNDTYKSLGAYCFVDNFMLRLATEEELRTFEKPIADDTLTANPNDFLLPAVFFETASHRLGIASQNSLDSLADYLIENKFPIQQIKLKGYADYRGSEAYNRQLAQKRVEAVKAYLVSKGVVPHIILLDGVEIGSASSSFELQRRVSFVYE